MYGHECESDEDCEVYFLKPVNEYNIVDKIKEANKELFEDVAAAETNGASTADNVETQEMGTNVRKVTFAVNLEAFDGVEPNPKEVGDAVNEDEKLQQDLNGIQMKLAADFNFPAIDEAEEEETNDQENILEPALIENSAETTEILHVESEIVEEICEEIMIMDMDENANQQPEVSSNGSMEWQQQRSRILKQTTFDFGDRDLDEIGDDNNNKENTNDDENGHIEDDENDNVSDSKSLTNLLTSDFEEEEELDEQTNQTIDDNEFDGDDDDDDDQLSIIVASYIPESYDKQKLSMENNKNLTKCKKLSFTKRFSFRRKNVPNNAIEQKPQSPGGNNSCCRRRHVPPPEVTDLKLNYKTCCEYRNAVQLKLPKYTGYLSEYGLTREQLAEREQKLQQKQRFCLAQALQSNAQDMRKMQDNERAFTSWLKQKMRFPINKTRNMFDVKAGGSSCVGGSAVRNRSAKK